ncbi:SDR family oxidoreductase [Marinobacter sp. R17]|uniref:oxidoreductase n=1 Tax=Marinobacter sp. R17 TaxID=2484250 RepID=UPI000F4B4344|nr:oxidoreductase [Marinobacter sp. R17]ROT99311.1 SDR family oxidoreductase [Marinobacter sp. R17]
MLLENKVILVVGAGGVIGSEIVRAVVREGGRVIAADVNMDLVRPLVNEFGEGTVLPVRIDITDKASIEQAFAVADKTWHRVTGAVNTAYPRNRNYGRKALEVTYEDFCENVSLHLGGYFLFMQQCAVYSQKRDIEFSLVNMSSIYGSITPKFEIYNNTDMTMPVEYAAIKSAVQHTTSYFNAYMKGGKFRANCVSPGGVENGQNKDFLQAYHNECNQKGMLESRDICGSVVFLLSALSSYVIGQNIIVDDGFCV